MLGYQDATAGAAFRTADAIKIPVKTRQMPQVRVTEWLTPNRALGSARVNQRTAALGAISAIIAGGGESLGWGVCN